ncbi:MAG: MmgE/PrpD family protein [Desulfobacterales bacterium]|nr:MmgE/PrpD family protein [Desulfobacterales bacterium]
MFSTEKLAARIINTRYEDLPPSVSRSVSLCLLDLIGVACAGYNTASATAMRRTVKSLVKPGPATVWFSSDKLLPCGAALANASSASALDLDDGHRKAAGHPGASIIPAAIAQGQAAQASWQDIVKAVVLGYETGCRISKARDFEKLPTMSTGRWCAYGAAVAVGTLRGLEPVPMAQAIAIAGVQSPELSAAGYSVVMGNHVKEGIPWATMTGMVAVDLAQSGLSGPLDILDNPDYYDSDIIFDRWGEKWAVDEIYFKPYACCRWIHAAIDALTSLISENSIVSGEIEAVEVFTFRRALMLSNETDPSSVEGAQYSLPFCLALTAVEGIHGLRPVKPEHLGRPDLVEFASKVSLTADDDLDALFPDKAPARVRILYRGKQYRKIIYDPWGDPGNPFSQNDLEEKFISVTLPYLDCHVQEKILECIRDWGNIKLGGLLDMLG